MKLTPEEIIPEWWALQVRTIGKRSAPLTYVNGAFYLRGEKRTRKLIEEWMHHMRCHLVNKMTEG